MYRLRYTDGGVISLAQAMPTVAIEGQFRFVVNTRENTFEPPHVHVWVGNEDVCRIELNGGQFMDEPPPGDYRRITWRPTHGMAKRSGGLGTRSTKDR